MATNGNDFLFFQGSLGQLVLNLVNPYSGFEILIDDEFNINNTSYDGLGGDDFLVGTNFGDYLNIREPLAIEPTVKNVEVFIAGDGGDVIQLADTEFTLGDIQILGGAGDDILWANVGNDEVRGFNGNDILDGGPGHDELFGENDDDLLFGGEGNDRLDGGSGNDILFGGTDLGLIQLDKDFVDDITFPDLIEGTDIVNLVPPGTPALGINNDNLTVDFDATASITFREGFAGYNNTLGIYKINEDGTIDSASVLWANVKDAGIDVTHSVDLPVGAEGGEFGFFIIANGDRVNGQYDGLDITGDGVISFVYDLGGAGERAATVNDDGSMVSIVYDDGVTVDVLGGHHYHTTPRGETPDINWDGQTHAVSGIIEAGNDDVLRIGFEDLPNLGDADYEDVLFDLDIDAIHVDASETGSDTLIGGGGDDILYGEGGDDILVIGIGSDEAWGGSGADIFEFVDAIYEVYEIANEAGLWALAGMDSDVDIIHDFDASEGDVIDLSNILDLGDTDPVSAAINDFIAFSDSGDDTVISVDVDGAENGETFIDIAVVKGGLNDTVLDMINNGSLEAAAV